jgi:hypothetical protein
MMEKYALFAQKTMIEIKSIIFSIQITLSKVLDKMKIYLNEIKEKFKQLIDEKTSRELIAKWAKERQIAEDNDQLEYVPSEEKTRLWKAVLYLMGVDLLDMDGSYLHSINNFIELRDTMGF